MVKIYISDEINHSGRNLIEAVYREDVETVTTLLQNGAPINYKCEVQLVENDGGVYDREITPLILAVKMKNIAIVRLLLAKNPELNSSTYYSYEAFIEAAAVYNHELMNLLLQHEYEHKRTNPKTFSDQINSALQGFAFAARGSQNNYVVNLLLNLDRAKEHKATYLHSATLKALRNSQDAVLTLLLEQGANPNGICSSEQKTYLTIAAENSSPTKLKLLLEYGANPDLANGEGKTALDVAEGETLHVLLRFYKQLDDAIAYSKADILANKNYDHIKNIKVLTMEPGILRTIAQTLIDWGILSRSLFQTETLHESLLRKPDLLAEYIQTASKDNVQKLIERCNEQQKETIANIKKGMGERENGEIEMQPLKRVTSVVGQEPNPNPESATALSNGLDEANSPAVALTTTAAKQIAQSSTHAKGSLEEHSDRSL